MSKLLILNNCFKLLTQVHNVWKSMWKTLVILYKKIVTNMNVVKCTKSIMIINNGKLINLV
jgi:hypothetical protein